MSNNKNILHNFCISSENVENKGIWNNFLPTCQLILCPSLPSIHENGKKICSDGRRLGSSCRWFHQIRFDHLFQHVCRYDCEKNFKLIGSKTINCINDEDDLSIGRWNQEEPKCEGFKFIKILFHLLINLLLRNIVSNIKSIS